MKMMSTVLLAFSLAVLVGCKTDGGAGVAKSGKAGPTLDVDDTSFQKVVLDSTQPVLVDFWAPWCGPCVQVGPVVAEVAGEFEGRAVVAKVNVDNSPEVSKQYEITAIPALIVFKGGKEVARMIGVQSKEALASKLNEALK